MLSFRVLGIPVRLSFSFFVVTLVLGAGAGSAERIGIWLAVVFVSILWHELGHAVVALALGHRPEIELGTMGGLTRWSPDATPSPGQELLTSLAGPLAGFLLGGAVFLATLCWPPAAGTALADAVRQATWVNLGWGALNLLPLLPYDGGHVLRAILDTTTKGRGLRPAQIVSIGVGAAAVALALWKGWYWAAYLAGLGAYSSWKGLGAGRAAAADAPLWERVQSVWSTRSAAEREEARAGNLEVYHLARGQELKRAAVEQLAWSELLESGPERALAQLQLLPPGSAASPLLQAAILVRRGRPGEALPILQAAHRDGPTIISASMLFEALVALGRPDEAAATVADGGLGRSGLEALQVASTINFYVGQYRIAADMSEAAFDRGGAPDDAYNAACSCAQLGEPDQAFAWLFRALEAGYRDRAHLEADPDLDPLHDDPRFAELLA